MNPVFVPLRRLFPLLALLLLAATSGWASPRLRIRFDDGWRFRRDADPKSGGEMGPLSWQWKPADRDLDLQTLPSDIDSGPWKPTRLGRNELRNGIRFGWFRADLGSNPLDREKVLHFESVDDNAVVFVNGIRLKRQDGYGTPFDVPVFRAWSASGPNRLVVLVENTGGWGGINGSVTFAKPPPPESLPAEAATGFSDKAWRTVHLPHDYVVEGTFKQGENVSHGSLPRPTAWYRKTFTIPPSYRGKRVWIDFDGVYRNSTVYLNGRKLGHESSGYIGFRYDLTDRLQYGKPNVLAVRVDPTKDEGWWYEGAGIYRHVWLNVTSPVHVVPDGTFVTSNVGAGRASLTISTSIANDSSHPTRVVLTSEIYDPAGHRVATIRKVDLIEAGKSVTVNQHSDVVKPTLWSLESPRRYQLKTSIQAVGDPTYHTIKSDEVNTPFGIRTIRFDKDKGFFLNGKPVKLKGTCNHQDHAGVGTAMPDGLLEWRIQRLKSMGSNAYRCSHNPPAAELLDACDRLGMLVMDETRHLGDATQPKSPRGTTADDLSELKRLVLRDRNHPSVIMWSLFNEEPLQGSPEGAAIYEKMVAAVRKLDPTRPCTGAANGGYGSGIQLVSELFGFNYNIGAYDNFHRRFPNQPMYGSETASTVSTRGIYANDTVRGYVSAYDVNHPAWAETAEHAWKPIAERPWMAGGFVWTGFDYKGEPTPYGWPCVNSHFGILDICGFPKDNFYYYKAWWGDKPVVHLLPHWNWPGKEGQKINVWVQSNADRVELLVNGRSVGSKPVPRFEHAEWDVPYEPGMLEARGYRGNKLIASDRIDTTGAPAAIRLKTTRSRLLADEEDLSPVEVEIVDARGRVVPTADNMVKFSISGPGHVAGVGNGDPSSHEPDKASKRHAFNGLCMALVQATNRPGRIVVTATSPGLKGASLVLTSH
ncbi:beta-galactosidase GalA [Fimbriimonas ginsengisoli]|uniref:Beta-galactosidase n=1 Tax=Fimbriimonas ginsengisoli Gsoil 348 TaxID=661478 RepID=A0A068NKT3_FIMGI|nr:beta-galactosidase GalA [Fimbriimonas ginsengisoli]AIE84066.1 beta-galactosidase [Fimbriimonas ginsengisoli Gsoil 348]